MAVQNGITAKVHAVCISEKFALKIQLSAGNCHDALEGRKFIESLNCKVGHYLFMDCAYEYNEMLAPALMRGFTFVNPTEKTRKAPCQYDAKLYKHRN